MNETLSLTPETSKTKKVLYRTAGTFAAITLLGLFTITKVSENVVRDWALVLINQGLAEARLSMTAEEFQLGFIPKPNIFLKRVSIQNLTTNQYFQLDSIKLSPSILSLFTGKLGANIYIPMGDGNVDATVGVGGRNFSVSVTGSNLGLDRVLALAGFPGIKTKGQLSADIQVGGDLYTPPTWNGTLKLTGNAISILPQNLMGIELPMIKISEVKNKLTLTNGKIKVDEGNTGKLGDDLFLQLSGDMTLQNRIEDSSANLKIALNLSSNITSSLTILDAILSSSKQPDGSYGYFVTGSLFAPLISPIMGPGQ